MSDMPIDGGAGPALAAHSKDGAAPGANPASRVTGDKPSGATDTMAGTVSRLSGQARDAAGRAASSVSDATGRARQRLAEQGVSAEQVTDFVHERPVAALLLAGALGMVLGMLAVRR